MLTVDECKKACEYLGISRMGNFKEGRPCYKSGTGVCNQNIKKPGSSASRVCKGIEYKYNPFHSIEMFLFQNIESKALISDEIFIFVGDQ